MFTNYTQYITIKVWSLDILLNFIFYKVYAEMNLGMKNKAYAEINSEMHNKLSEI